MNTYLKEMTCNITFRKNLLFIIVCLFVVSCQTGNVNNKESIQVKDLEYFLAKGDSIRHWDLSKFDCKEPTDTLYRNLPYSYQEGLTEIKKQFQKIDSLPYNKATKEYAKALVAADFVYASFSYQFLGTKQGLARDSTLLTAWAQWDTLPLNICYELGNYNQVSVYCSQRTSFYLRLIDTLLGIKGFSVTIPHGVHVFPVLNLQCGQFIVDPYDPFVLCDSTGTQVIDYKSLLKDKLNGNFVPKRTRRLYGNSRELVSLPYVAMLKDEYHNKENDCFCCVLQNYLSVNKVLLMNRLPPCYVMPEEPLFENTFIIHNNRNIYSIGIAGRVDGPLVTHNDIIRYYVGLECDQGGEKKNAN